MLLAPYQFFSQAVMMMRAWAFTGRDWRMFIVLGLSYSVLLGIDIWAFCTHIYMPPRAFYDILGPTGCFPNYGSGLMAIRIGISMLAATLMDLVSLAIVVIYCNRESSFHGGSLADYFVKQGAFIAVTIVNVAAATAFFKPPAFHSGIGLPLCLVLPNLVACRVILQLRRRVTPSPTELSRINSCLVRSALGKMDTDKDQDVWLMKTDPSPILPHTRS
ncbi:hypothetical protein EST38_g3493 [Candolleomyces aberdarensis]|uniref:Uncharacterized protein n=1 Tax=Candolleomyces aberdarensis TaxID=2316362 RepID=A0A4Q2DTE5_9AGAR|nr:hypothetical protein EST38_g3493 [Candolleomyces aberdarensis]